MPQSQSPRSQQAKLAARRRSMQFQAGAQLELNPSDLAQLALPLGETPHRAASQEATRCPPVLAPELVELAVLYFGAAPAENASTGLTGGYSHG